MIYVAIVAILVVVIIPVVNYRKTDYYKITHNSFYKTHSNLGLLGEYMCYKYLRYLENTGARFLFNLYIPRDDTTTEIDVLMIHPTGLYVLESKNYSGWIFGSETGTYWTRTLPQGNRSIKNKFLNPILQNKTHIKYLQKLIGEAIPYYNIVVFSERCTFKSLTIDPSADYKVIQRNNLQRTISGLIVRTTVLSSEQMNQIYISLYPYSQATEETKQEHIKRTSEMKDSKDKI